MTWDRALQLITIAPSFGTLMIGILVYFRVGCVQQAAEIVIKSTNGLMEELKKASKKEGYGEGFQAGSDFSHKTKAYTPPHTP